MDLKLPPHIPTLGGEVQLAANAALAAGQIVRDGAASLASVRVEAKGVGDLVSEVDRQADQAATEVLHSTGERVPILSEELRPDTPDADEMWIVDPLDGTGAYLMQVGPQFPAVLVAKREQGRTTCGVCLFPLTDEWFYAIRGQGAWRNGKELIVNEPRRLKDVWVESNQYGDAALETKQFRALTEALRSERGAGLVTCNTAYSGVAARIAEGRTALSACIHDNRRDHVKQAPWDIAAPQLILEEAGGVYWNLEGKPVDPFVAEVIVVAQSAALADEVLQLAS